MIRKLFSYPLVVRTMALCLLATCLLLAPMSSAQGQAFTLSLRGLGLRHLAHRPADGWHMVAPIDVSRPGSTSIDLIAGESRVIGSLSITVGEEDIRWEPIYWDGVKVSGMALTLYTDSAQIGRTGAAGEAVPLDQPLALSATMREAGLLWLWLTGSAQVAPEATNIGRYTAQGAREIQERIDLAARSGIAENYLERLPLPEAPGPGIPDENGCIDGVCPMPTLPPMGEGGWTFPKLP